MVAWYEKGVLLENLEQNLTWTRLHNEEASEREFDAHHSGRKKMSLSNLEDLKYFDIVIWNENWKGENRGVKLFQITD